MSAAAIAEAATPSTPSRPHGTFPTTAFRFRGLDWNFWLLQAYFFIGLGAVDEEWVAVARFRPRLILGSLVLFAAVRRAAGRPEDRPPGLAVTKPARWLLLFTVAGFLSALWAFDPVLSWTSTVEQGVRILGFFLLVGTIRTRRQFLITVLVFAAGHGFYLVRSYLEYLNGRFDFQMGVRRMLGAGSSYADANSFAASVVFALPLVVWAGIHLRAWWIRVGALVYAGLGAVCVILTHSRGGLVILLLSALWLLAAIPRRLGRLAAAAVLVVMGVLLAGGLTDEAVQRYAGIISPDTYENEPSAAGRIWGYKVAWRAFQEYPWLGVGPGSFTKYKEKRIDGVATDPHNLAGELLSTRGVVGTVTFLGYVVTLVTFALRDRRRRRGSVDPWDGAVRTFEGAMLYVLFLLFVAGLGAHNLARPAWYWYPGLLLVAATCRPEPGDAVGSREVLTRGGAASAAPPG